MNISPPLNIIFHDPGILAEPLTVEGVDNSDPEGHVSLEILGKGTRIVIPLWQDPGPNDELWVFWLQNDEQEIIFEQTYPTTITDPFIYVDLSPQQMAVDGKAYLYYQVWKGGGGNPDDSPERELTINHNALVTATEPEFPHANLWGYLNNKTVPSLLQGVTVRVPSTTNVATPRDRCVVTWTGYSSLNGSGVPVAGTHSEWSRTLDSNDIANGYSLVIPFEKYVRPLIDNDSAIASYYIFRGFRPIAKSKKGLVKIDRVTPGESGPYGSGATSLDKETVTKMAIQIRPAKTRVFIERSGILTVDAIVDKLADGSIPVAVLDSGEITLKADNFLDPQDGDEVEVKYRVKGQTDWLKVDGYYELGTAAGRGYPVELKVPANLFPEAQTPASPTIYEVEYDIYKGGQNNSDQSTVVEFAIDRTAPYQNKITGVKGQPDRNLTITNRPAGPGFVWDEVWMAANPTVNCTVPVAYPLRRLDDEIEYFLVAPGTTVSAYKGTVPATGAFAFDSALLRTLPNLQRVSHYYKWTDLPGNVSADSASVPVFDLRLAQDPELLPPEVPKTDPNRTVPLYLDDFAPGAPAVNAIVRQPLHGLPTDDITLMIEDAADSTNYVEFGPLKLGTTDVIFPLDYVTLSSLIDPDSRLPLSVHVWYIHERDGKPLDGPGIYIDLEFIHGGPIHPGLPDLTNPDLDVVTVTGASATDNVIQPGDRDKPGKVSVPAWFGLPDIVGGEEINFYIDGKLAGTFKPFGGETTFEAILTAAFLGALPTATVKAYYTVGYVGKDKNVIRSSERDVVVNARKILLQEPTIRIRKGDEISCFTMDTPTTDWKMALGIPKDATNLPPGKAITVHFVGVTDITGTTTVSGTDDSQPYTIKAAGVADVAHVGTATKLKANQPVRGIKTFGKYWYTTDIGGLQTSEPVIKAFDIINTSFKYCDLTDAPAAP
jgi:hypothetical protein